MWLCRSKSGSRLYNVRDFDKAVHLQLPDFVACPKPDPLRDRSILLGLLGQDPLDLEGLLRRLQTATQYQMSC